MDNALLESQKPRDMLAAFWPRKVSPLLTKLLLPTRITPNQATVLWGVVSVVNSWLVYQAMLGDYRLVPAIFAVYVLAFTLDCVDGEIARYRKIANPVGGKLIDGVCHRATEYSLLVAFALGGLARTGWPVVVPIGLLMIAGEAMYTYVYERRLMTLRVHAGYTGRVSKTDAGLYERGARFRDLTSSQQLGTVTGLLHYKSVYPVIAASYLPAPVFVAGLAALAFYKHLQWLRLFRATMQIVANPSPAVPPVDAETRDAAAPGRVGG
jgi:phosphatidylglycerophosphate synthase